MRRFFCVCLLVLVFASTAFADSKIGTLARLNEEQFNGIAQHFFQVDGSLFSQIHLGQCSYIFFDNMPVMLMALNEGFIDEIDTVAVVARYIMNSTGKYKLTCIDYNDTPSYFSFGLLEGRGNELRDRINTALRDMRADGTLTRITLDYTVEPGIKTPAAVSFEKFDNAPEIRVALTGDIPPLDFVNADGTPAGFNTALLAEIGRRLKVNIIPVNVDTNSKTAALVSGRADVVFWYLNEYGDNPLNFDSPEGVILTDPYYEFHDYMHISKK